MICLKEITDILPKDVSIVSVRQPKPLGLGHAVLCAKSIVGDNDFAVLLPDVLVKNKSEKNDLARMIERYETVHAAQIMVEAVPEHLVDQYGIVDVPHSPAAGESIVMQGIVEKACYRHCTVKFISSWALYFTRKNYATFRTNP